MRAAGSSEASGDVRAELARIERAILRCTPDVLEEFGGLQIALKRSVTRSKQARSGIDPLRRHLEIGAPLRSPIPMSGPRVTPLLGCANDTGSIHNLGRLRFTRAWARNRLCGNVLRVREPTGRGRTGRATGDGSTPPLDAPVVTWTRVCFHTPRLGLWRTRRALRYRPRPGSEPQESLSPSGLRHRWGQDYTPDRR